MGCSNSISQDELENTSGRSLTPTRIDTTRMNSKSKISILPTKSEDVSPPTPDDNNNEKCIANLREMMKEKDKKLEILKEKLKDSQNEKEILQEDMDDLMEDYQLLMSQYNQLKGFAGRIKIKRDSPLHALPSMTSSPGEFCFD